MNCEVQCLNPFIILYNQTTKIMINLVLVVIILLLLLIGWLCIQRIQRWLRDQERADYITMVLQNEKERGVGVQMVLNFLLKHNSWPRCGNEISENSRHVAKPRRNVSSANTDTRAKKYRRTQIKGQRNYLPSSACNAIPSS